MRLGCVVLLAATALVSGAVGGAEPGSGIAGKIQAAPVCPVETVPPQPGCAPRGIAASLRVRRWGRRTARVVHSSSGGSFRVHLVPGTYLVQPLQRAGSPYPRPPGTRRLRVRAGRFTFVTITYDTGIR